jgi:hypothetical protein
MFIVATGPGASFDPEVHDLVLYIPVESIPHTEKWRLNRGDELQLRETSRWQAGERVVRGAHDCAKKENDAV